MKPQRPKSDYHSSVNYLNKFLFTIFQSDRNFLQGFDKPLSFLQDIHNIAISNIELFEAPKSLLTLSPPLPAILDN